MTHNATENHTLNVIITILLLPSSYPDEESLSHLEQQSQVAAPVLIYDKAECS